MSIFKLLRHYRSRGGSAGISFIELIIIMSILVVLFTLTTANITPLIPKAEARSAIDVLIADIKAQQARAMLGDTDGSSAPQSFGIYIESNRYTLFTGSSYSSSNPTNAVIPLASSLSASSTLPSNLLIFSPGSGDMVGYSVGSDTITIQDDTSTVQRQIQLNRYGTVIAIN